jgi:guanylate kinase
MTPKLIIFSAPSGSGKTSIVKEILKTDIPFGFSISATSRPPRKDEKHAKDYYFLSVNEFKNHIKRNDFLEWEEVYHNQYYGTLKSEVDRLRNEGKNVIFDVDVVGGLNIKEYYGDDALAIFVKAPSVDELKNRLQSRGTEDAESLQKRLNKAEQELSFAENFDIVIINDKLDIAVKECISRIREFISL